MNVNLTLHLFICCQLTAVITGDVCFSGSMGHMYASYAPIGRAAGRTALYLVLRYHVCLEIAICMT